MKKMNKIIKKPKIKNFERGIHTKKLSPLLRTYVHRIINQKENVFYEWHSLLNSVEKLEIERFRKKRNTLSEYGGEGWCYASEYTILKIEYETEEAIKWYNNLKVHQLEERKIEGLARFTNYKDAKAFYDKCLGVKFCWGRASQNSFSELIDGVS